MGGRLIHGIDLYTGKYGTCFHLILERQKVYLKYTVQYT